MFVIANGDGGNIIAAADKITEFNTAGADQLKLGVAGTALNYVEAASTHDDNANANANASTMAENAAQANVALDGVVKYAVIANNALNSGIGNAFVATGSFLFVDTDLDGSFNYAVSLTDGVLNDIALGDIIV